MRSFGEREKGATNLAIKVIFAIKRKRVFDENRTLEVKQISEDDVCSIAINTKKKE